MGLVVGAGVEVAGYCAQALTVKNITRQITNGTR